MSSNFLPLTGLRPQRHRRALAAIAVLPLCLLAASGGVHAQQSRGGAFDHLPVSEDFDDSDKTWTEISTKLPPAPQPANMLPLFVSPTATQQFAVDGTSVSVGADGVVRYTLVSTSEYGARNISYEGIRCETAEQKLYAVGHPDGSWSRSRNDSWKRIDASGGNRLQAVLFADFVCNTGLVDGDAKAITERLRKGRKRNATSTGQ